MRYVFGPYVVEPAKGELRRDGTVLPVEPQVLALIELLLENSERIVSKDEIVRKIWDGRAVSEAAISSRVKSARRALGDDGRDQRYIRTLHGRGLRFVGEVRVELSGPACEAAPGPPPGSAPMPAEAARPSIAVLPFLQLGSTDPPTAMGDAIAHDLIASLSRLRWLFVIARGSAFRFRGPDLDVCEIGRLLGVDYCLSGLVEVFERTATVIVELTDIRTGGVLWGDRHEVRMDDVHAVRARVIAAIIAALEIQIPLNEAQLASVADPESLDAWSIYHLGLQHLYRFNERDNAAAVELFRRATELEPGFARAHAGLSSAHFQNAFMRYTDAPGQDVLQARRCAERGIELDPVDPFANFTLGRAFWLTSDIEASLSWLERCTMLSPNYAQGFYARAWADTVSERGLDGEENVNVAMALSPLDPFRYAMLGTRALICLGRGDTAGAAEWGERAARSPGAHVLIAMIALVAHALNRDQERAEGWAREARSRRPDLSQAHFLASFPFKEGRLRRDMGRVLDRFGF